MKRCKAMEDMILSYKQEQEDYEYVERYWSDHHAMTYGRFDICDMEGNFDYSAARRFTDDRLEEIRQVEAEIALVDYDGKGGPDWDELINGRIGKEFGLSANVAQQKIRWCRILASRVAVLAELKKGMKI
jgi:hypothetical protein